MLLLLSKKGYLKDNKLKVSYNYLENRLNTSKDIIQEAVQSIRKGRNLLQEQALVLEKAYLRPKPEQLQITTPGTYFVTGCVHAPWQNKRMYNSIYNYIDKEIKLDGIILDGDVLDMHSLSRHDRGKIAIPGVTLDYEYKEANKFMNEIDSLRLNNQNSNKIFIFGNHEDRYFRALSEIDISKYGSALKSPSEALKLSERGYQVIEDFKSGHVLFGNHLEINHGEFINVHTAKKTIDTYRKSVLYFHTHRFQIYTEGLVGGWNMGWGGDINAPVFNYATRAMKKSWQNGAAIVTLSNNGSYHVQPLLFIKDKLIVNGKEY